MQGNGLCECGCGGRTKPYRNHAPKLGQVKGEPCRFIFGHQRRVPVIAGYRQRSIGGGKKRDEHIQVVERVIGKRLPPQACVHHIDDNKSNNAHSNLVACDDRAYHNLIHRRARALAVCGHADWRYCWHCRKYDAPENLKHQRSGKQVQVYHMSCRIQYMKDRRRINAERSVA